MTDWIRRGYTSLGLTQSPPGRYLSVLQAPHLGKVILCIDVSGSMGQREEGRTRLEHAVAGAERFVADAVANHYQVGLILWNTGVARSVPIGDDPAPVTSALRAARPGGGNDIVPTLRAGIDQLGPLSGDRVLAVFGDGDLGHEGRAVAAAKDAARLGIRIIVRGLGEHAAKQMSLIATDPEDASGPTTVAAAGDIEGAIASMAKGMRGIARR
jgi:uncharacterized protein (DUF58 family)